MSEWEVGFHASILLRNGVREMERPSSLRILKIDSV